MTRRREKNGEQGERGGGGWRGEQLRAGATFIGVVWCQAGEEVTSHMGGQVDDFPRAPLLPECLV